MGTEISQYDDVIDSRDVMARIEELTGIEESDRDSEEIEELKILESLAKDGNDYNANWNYGEPLIRDSYFTEYAQELAKDCGMLENINSWPGRCIDWDQVVRELQIDYSTIDFDGTDYWIRSC